MASADLNEVPHFSHQLPSIEVRQIVEPLLDCRALIAVCNLDFETYSLNILNSDEKIILRLILEDHELFDNRIILLPIKGYDKATEQIVELLTTDFGLVPNHKPLLICSRLKS